MVKGQVLIEALIGLTLLLIVLLAWQEDIVPQAQRNQQALASQRDNLWARTANPNLTTLSEDYSAAKMSGKLLNNVSKLVELDFDTKNLRQTNPPDKNTQVADYKMARLTDAWSPLSPEQLAGRPRKLVVNAVLSNNLITTIQDGLGWLFFAEEHHSSSLIFGHIDTDVAPEKALKRIPYR